jgi:hypothetical protein
MNTYFFKHLHLPSSFCRNKNQNCDNEFQAYISVNCNFGYKVNVYYIFRPYIYIARAA